MKVGKLYKCLANINSTHGLVRKGEYILVTDYRRFEGWRKGQWRKGHRLRFLHKDQQEQIRFILADHRTYFKLVEL
jgi:hypothetical protein